MGWNYRGLRCQALADLFVSALGSLQQAHISVRSRAGFFISQSTCFAALRSKIAMEPEDMLTSRRPRETNGCLSLVFLTGNPMKKHGVQPGHWLHSSEHSPDKLRPDFFHAARCRLKAWKARDEGPPRPAEKQAPRGGGGVHMRAART